MKEINKELIESYDIESKGYRVKIRIFKDKPVNQYHVSLLDLSKAAWLIIRKIREEIINEISLDDGFKYAGQYYEDGCRTKMYKKEYEVTFLYIHVDCKGNRSKYHKDK